MTALRLRRTRSGFSLSRRTPRSFSPPSSEELFPCSAGARVFPEAQPREWGAPANSSSEGLGNNSGVKGRALGVILRSENSDWTKQALLTGNDLTRPGCLFLIGQDGSAENDTLKLN